VFGFVSQQQGMMRFGRPLSEAALVDGVP